MKKWPWFLISLLVLLFDQGSKHWVQAHYLAYETKPLLPMLNLTLAYNTGVAFSLLSHIGSAWHQWILAGISSIMSIVLMSWMITLPKQAKGQLLALCLILGGALGNLVDRASLGYVIDFIDVFYKNYHWPVFNIADMAICFGTALLAFELYKGTR